MTTGLGVFDPTWCGRCSSAATNRSRSRSTDSFCLGGASVSSKRRQRDGIRRLLSRRTSSEPPTHSAFLPDRSRCWARGRGRQHSAPPRFRTIQFGPTKCVDDSTDLRCKSGIACAGLVMPTVTLTRILSEAVGISSVGIRLSSVSRSVSATIDPANVPTVGSMILCVSM